jgi:hypothetical protein
VVRAEPKRVYLDGGIEAGEWVVTTAMDAPIPGTKLAINGMQEDAAAPVDGVE